MTTSNESKCNCQYCNGHITFPAEMAGQSINCPHCQLETLLFISAAAVPIKQPPPTRKNTNAVRVLVVAIILAAGFAGAFLLKPLLLTKSQKQTEQSKPTNLKPVLGAFGWKLGDKLPEQLKSKAHDGTYRFMAEQEMPPFDQCEIHMTDDGRIYCIEASGYTPDHGLDPDNCKSALISLLSEKYGLRHLSQVELMSMLKPVGDNYYFGTVDRTAHLSIFEDKLFTLEYYDEALRSVHYDEQEAKRQKDEAEQKARLSKGL